VANAYATTFELMDRLGLEFNDEREPVLSDTLEAASRWIDRVIGRRFYSVTETRYYYLGPLPYSQITIDDALSVTSVMADTNGDGVYESTWVVGQDYWLGPRNAVADGRPYTTINRTALSNRWDVIWSYPYAEATLAVTGAFGYCTLANRPLEIRELCLTIAGQIAGGASGTVAGAEGTASDLAIPGVAEYRIGSVLSVKMDTSGNSAALAASLPLASRRIIATFRRPTAAFA